MNHFPEIFVCPTCRLGLLRGNQEKLNCESCKAIFWAQNGVFDLLENYPGGATVLQWAMERGLIVSVYENFLRPAFTRFFSKGEIEYDKEAQWLNAILPPNVDLALDLAAGTGRYTQILNSIRKPKLIVAIDISLAMLEEAKRKNDSDGITNVIYLRADAHDLPIRSGVFDVIVCFGAFHLFNHPAQAIGEIGRISREAASLAILTAGQSDRHSKFRISLISTLLAWTIFPRSFFEYELKRYGFSFSSYQLNDIVLTFSATRENLSDSGN